MKAAVLYDINIPLKVEDVTLDDPQENEILVSTCQSYSYDVYFGYEWGCNTN